MLGLGPAEMLVIIIVALLIFGPHKLPEMGKAIGKAIGEFKKMTSDIEKQIREEVQSVEDVVKPVEELKELKDTLDIKKKLKK